MADRALELNPKYMKAYFRKAKCLLTLKKYKECVDVCN